VRTDTWPVIHTERKALAADLQALDAGDWATPSLCEEWTVRDVLAHLTSTATLTSPAFFGGLVTAGFSSEKAQRNGIAAHLGAAPADTLTGFEAVLTSVTHPPGPADAWLSEMIVHSEDIRRPLGIEYVYPPAVLVQVADFFKGSNKLISARRRIGGLALHATDADWSHGTGPEVSGPILSLILAMTGREVADDELGDDGAWTLRARS
jgi:uncharacterized protein (TIGR03083 family)